MKDIIDIGKERAKDIGLETVGGWYHVNDVHRVLGEGVETRGAENHAIKRVGHPVFGYHTGLPIDLKTDTHKALLIAIRPIEKPKADEIDVPDEAIKIVREFNALLTAYLKKLGGE